MANFLEGLGNILMHPIDEAKFLWKEGVEDVGKNLIRGDFGEAWDELKGIPGEHNRMMRDNVTVPLFGHNKLSENPDAVAGAVVGSIFAAPAVMGALGGGSSSAFSLGDVGGYFKPKTEFGKLGQVADFSGAKVPSFDSAGQNVGYKPFDAGNIDLMQGTGGAGGEEKEGTGSKLQKIAKVLESVKGADQPELKSIASRVGGGGGVRFDPSLYENPLLAREFKEMYSSPLYKKLI